jgi:hypothetical protein
VRSGLRAVGAELFGLGCMDSHSGDADQRRSQAANSASRSRALRGPHGQGYRYRRADQTTFHSNRTATSRQPAYRASGRGKADYHDL